MKRLSSLLPTAGGKQAPRQTGSGSLTKTDVEYAYRLILGREPESRAAVDAHLDRCKSLADLRKTLLASEEYNAKEPEFVAPLPPELLRPSAWPQIDSTPEPLGVDVKAASVEEKNCLLQLSRSNGFIQSI